MAKLIMCPACSNQVSDDARACPKCGAPIKKGMGIAGKIGLGFLGLCVLAAIGNAGSNSKGNGGSSAPSAAPAAPAAPTPAAPAAPAAPTPAPAARSAPPAARSAPPSIAVTAEQLRKAYEANEVSADDLYLGKVLEVSGVVDSIKKDFTGDPYVVLRTTNPFMGVHASFEDNSGLSALGAGRKITLRCIGNNVTLGSPVLKDCVLE
jgi:hypothetical protein